MASCYDRACVIFVPSRSRPEWGIGVAEQDQIGVGRQAAPIEIEVDGFGPDRDQAQRGQLKWGGHLGWHRIAI
jgi:hypothetical protein